MSELVRPEAETPPDSPGSSRPLVPANARSPLLLDDRRGHHRRPRRSRWRRVRDGRAESGRRRRPELSSTGEKKAEPKIRTTTRSGGPGEEEGRRPGTRRRHRLAEHRRAALAQEGPQGQGRPARLLDALLHQLHPHPARPRQAGEEVRRTSWSSSASTRRSSRTRRTPRASARRSCATRSNTRWSTTPTTRSGTATTSTPGRRSSSSTRRATSSATPPARGTTTCSTRSIGKLIKEHKKKKTLNEKPIRFDLATLPRDRRHAAVLPRQGARRRDGQAAVHRRQHAPPHRRHRPRRQESRSPAPATPGTRRRRVRQGQFDDPQGMALARRHALRRRPQEPPDPRLDLKAKTVTTVAGTGEQEHDAANAPARQAGAGAKHRAEQPVGPAPRRRHSSTSRWPGTTRSGRST